MCFQVGVVLLNFLKNAVFQHIITNKSPFTFNVILHQKSEKEEKLKTVSLHCFSQHGQQFRFGIEMTVCLQRSTLLLRHMFEMISDMFFRLTERWLLKDVLNKHFFF